MHATPSCCVWAHRTPLYACIPHVLPISMQNARKKNCARFQSVCAAKDSKRTGGHPAFVSQNQTCALAFWALISPYGRFPPMRYHSRDINAQQTTKSPPTAVSCPRSARGHSAEIARDAHDPRSFYAPKIARSIGCCP